uniref:Opticin n=1 Tax=Chelonoidis abingdonii TaxID=106734 RepID=A0A8C0GTE3_CHEAB
MPWLGTLCYLVQLAVGGLQWSLRELGVFQRDWVPAYPRRWLFQVYHCCSPPACPVAPSTPPLWRCELGRAREESVAGQCFNMRAAPQPVLSAMMPLALYLQIEVGTLAPPTKRLEAPIPACCCWLTAPSLPAPGLPTCLVCVCLSTSVYCDDAELEQIPPLPLETTYLYARFNRISHIRASDFTRLKKLKRIDLTSNFISWVDEDSFRLLSTLQELILAENRLTALPALPNSIVRLDARLNRIQSSDVRPEAFRELKKLQFLHLSDNNLDYIPVPLPEGLRSLHLQNNNIRTMHKDTFCDSQDHGHIRWALEDIRLDRNPINLSLFSDAYFCLPRLPTGHFY